MKYLQVEKDDEIALVTINRPDKLNAMNLAVMNEFVTTLEDFEKDSSKVIIITGAGQKAFSAGADIEYMSKIDSNEAEKYALRGHEVLNKIERLEKPVIAAINGYALVVVVNLALHVTLGLLLPMHNLVNQKLL